MYDIIKRYVENENENGLLLVDMPTGSGKTYSAIEFIYNSCMNPDNKDRKYIFVTTLKKNLPYEDLRKRFVESGNEELCQEKVLVIDSNMDSVVDGWSADVERAIPFEIKRCDEFQKLMDDLDTLYTEVPSTTDAAVEQARIALKITKDNNFSTAEIDSCLPDSLRRGTK